MLGKARKIPAWNCFAPAKYQQGAVLQNIRSISAWSITVTYILQYTVQYILIAAWHCAYRISTKQCFNGSLQFKKNMSREHCFSEIYQQGTVFYGNIPVWNSVLPGIYQYGTVLYRNISVWNRVLPEYICMEQCCTGIYQQGAVFTEIHQHEKVLYRDISAGSSVYRNKSAYSTGIWNMEQNCTRIYQLGTGFYRNIVAWNSVLSEYSSLEQHVYLNITAWTCILRE